MEGVPKWEGWQDDGVLRIEKRGEMGKQSHRQGGDTPSPQHSPTPLGPEDRGCPSTLE